LDPRLDQPPFATTSHFAFVPTATPPSDPAIEKVRDFAFYGRLYLGFELPYTHLFALINKNIIQAEEAKQKRSFSRKRMEHGVSDYFFLFNELFLAMAFGRGFWRISVGVALL